MYQNGQGYDPMEENVRYVEVERKEKKPIAIILLLLCILMAVIVGGLFLYSQLTSKTQFDIDREALEGWLPGKSAEDIESELNRIIDQSRFNVAINPTPVVKQDGTANFLIENVPANNYWMQVSVYYQDASGSDHLLYESKYIQQGFFIESGQVTHVPAPGEYNARAVFKAIIPESDEVMGETAATMMIYVEE